MFGVDFLGLHAGEILKQVSVCQIDDFWESNYWIVKFTRRVHNDHCVSTRQDVGTCQDALLIFFWMNRVLLSRESDVECYTLRVIGFIQYKATLSQVARVLLSCRKSRKYMPILEIANHIDQQCTTREVHISNLRLYTKEEALVSES